APAPGGRLAETVTGRLDAYAARAVCREATNRRWTAYQSLKRFAVVRDVCRRRQLLDHFGDDSPTAPDGRCCDVCAPIDWIDLDAIRTAPRRRTPAGSGTAAARLGTTAQLGTAAAPAPPPGPPVDEAEFEALRKWRYDRAEGKPAYTVAANATLEEVLRQRPASADELLAIRGIGPAFVEKHGDELLAVLATL
ncbi:MAG TPA: HRDC domain-containing protein, partial [Solirubrobacteraceae bacterium]|nr:HRDC domain-containing protein [Solirubrobacteraceae bacterium]